MALAGVAAVAFFSRWLFLPLGALLAFAALAVATLFRVSDLGLDDGRRRLSIAALRRSAMYDRDLGLYQKWYFDLRLEEEAARCRRYGLSMAVLIVKAFPFEENNPTAGWRDEAAAMAFVASGAIRAGDLCASTGPLEFSFLLLHCDAAGALAASDRLATAFAPIRCHIGTCLYPEDRIPVGDMIQMARRSAAIPLDTLEKIDRFTRAA